MIWLNIRSISLSIYFHYNEHFHMRQHFIKMNNLKDNKSYNKIEIEGCRFN